MYTRVSVDKKTHFFFFRHYNSVGNFSHVEIINLTGHFSTKMKNCISSAFQGSHEHLFLKPEEKEQMSSLCSWKHLMFPLLTF